jgi:hypothetical protein
MMGAKEFTSPAPKVRITSPGLAIEIISSDASRKLGRNTPRCIFSVINEELTPGIADSLAG